MTSATGPSPDRRTRGAFTLLELIAVLVLISTVLAIAAPSLRGFVHGRQTSDTAARILALTHLARSRAISRGSVHRLNIDAEARTYWLTAQEGGAFVELETDHGRVFELPVGVAIALDEATFQSPVGSARPVESEEEVPYVQFYPDGRCDPVTIELIGVEGEVLRVVCPSATERFRVVSPTEEERR